MPRGRSPADQTHGRKDVPRPVRLFAAVRPRPSKDDRKIGKLTVSRLENGAVSLRARRRFRVGPLRTWLRAAPRLAASGSRAVTIILVNNGDRAAPRPGERRRGELGKLAACDAAPSCGKLAACDAPELLLGSRRATRPRAAASSRRATPPSCSSARGVRRGPELLLGSLARATTPRDAPIGVSVRASTRFHGNTRPTLRNRKARRSRRRFSRDRLARW
jgi:hypothetical protein